MFFIKNVYRIFLLENHDDVPSSLSWHWHYDWEVLWQHQDGCLQLPRLKLLFHPKSKKGFFINFSLQTASKVLSKISNFFVYFFPHVMPLWKFKFLFENNSKTWKVPWAIPEKVRNPYVEEVGFSVQGGTPRKTWKIQGGQWDFVKNPGGSLKFQQKSGGVPQELAKKSRGVH